MTKFEIIGVYLTDEEKFNQSISEFRSKCRTLRIALSVSVHDSLILTFSQRQQVLKLCEQVEFLENSMLNWKFHGKKDQMELDFF